MYDWKVLAEKVLQGEEILDSEALSVLECPDDELLDLLAAAYLVRKRYYGNKVKLNMIINTKSGFCPENCGYCAQSRDSKAPIQKYRMMEKEQIIEGAEQAHKLKSGTYCIVASGRGPSRRELEIVTSAVEEIKSKYDMKICACLGLLKPEQAQQLKTAGVDRYNNNINTSANHHDNITTSHSYSDRVSTVNHAKEAGISPVPALLSE